MPLPRALSISALLIMLLSASLFPACKKDPHPSKSGAKVIETFTLRASDNAGVLQQDVTGVMKSDSILLSIPESVPLTQLTPFIEFLGVNMSPASHVPQDFSKPVKYTVTAEDGSTKTYTVVVIKLSGEKAITSFVFRSADNPSLAKDVTGIIDGTNILVYLPGTANISNLKPTITYKGKSINPALGQTLDFTSTVNYNVTAEDGSVAGYSVMAGKNAAAFFGSTDGYLYAVNLLTAGMFWRYSLGSQVTGITVANNVVYAGCTAGTMYALDITTGVVKWTYQRNGGAFTIPTVHSGKLYAGYIAPGSHMYSLVALDTANGGLSWESPISNTVDPNILYNPSCVDGVIYINTWSSGLYAFDAASGAPKWFYNTGLSASNAAIADGVVYVGTEGTVVTAIDAASGAFKWSFANPGNSNGSPTVYGDAVYIGSNTFMYAIHKSDGTLKWQYQALGGQSQLGDNTHSTRGHFSAAVISNGVLYAGCDDNLTYALNAETGAMVANYPNSMLEIRNSSPAPAVANGMVFTSREDNKLYVFDANLTLKWFFTAAYPVSTNVCVVDADGKVYYTGDSGDQQ